MVKNESVDIHTTLESVVDIIKTLVVLDTGSTDNTIKEIKDFSERNNIKLFLIEKPFVDFEISRNILLEYANSVLSEGTYTILLDAKDELRNGNLIEHFVKQHTDDAFFIRKQFEHNNQIEEFMSLAVLKIPTQWRYQGKVHEFLSKNPLPRNMRNIPNVTIYQLRSQEDMKKRNEWDIKILSKLNTKRSKYYLARTYYAMGNERMAFKFYKERTLYKNDFSQPDKEERYDSIINCAKIGFNLKLSYYEYVLPWIMLALEEDPDRAEPYIFLGAWYLDHKRYVLAKFFIDEACKKKYPNCIVGYNRFFYDTFRWKLKKSILDSVSVVRKC